MLKVSVKSSGWKDSKIIDQLLADIEEAVNDGYETAQANSSMEFKYGDKETNTSNEVVGVSMEEIPNGYAIRLSSNGAFIEFGAGDTTEANEYASKAPFDVSPGSYSKNNSRVYAKYKHWHHHGIDFRGVYPKRPLFKAMQSIKQNLQSKGYKVK